MCAFDEKAPWIGHAGKKGRLNEGASVAPRRVRTVMLFASLDTNRFTFLGSVALVSCCTRHALERCASVSVSTNAPAVDDSNSPGSNQRDTQPRACGVKHAEHPQKVIRTNRAERVVGGRSRTRHVRAAKSSGLIRRHAPTQRGGERSRRGAAHPRGVAAGIDRVGQLARVGLRAKGKRQRRVIHTYSWLRRAAQSSFLPLGRLVRSEVS